MILQRQAKSRLVCYPSEQILDIWERIEPHIQKALDRGSNYSIDDIQLGLCNQQMQCWLWKDGVIVHGVLITSIQTKEDVTFCLLLALAGSKMNEWIQYLPIVETWAKERGCSEMRIYGRIGWAKIIGYDIKYTKMVKEL